MDLEAKKSISFLNSCNDNNNQLIFSTYFFTTFRNMTSRKFVLSEKIKVNPFKCLISNFVNIPVDRRTFDHELTDITGISNVTCHFNSQ